MNFDETISSSLELAQKIEKKRFEPNGVIGIAIGGILPAHIISNYFRCPLILIRVARPITTVKKYFSLNKLPIPAKRFLRNMEMNLGLYRRMEARKITEICGKLSKRRYIVVDDSLDTGKTVHAVLKFLENEKRIKRKDVLIAVLTQMYDDANPQADCLIHNNVNFSFPWSRDSNEYNKFLNFCRDIPISDSIYL